MQCVQVNVSSLKKHPTVPSLTLLIWHQCEPDAQNSFAPDQKITCFYAAVPTIFINITPYFYLRRRFANPWDPIYRCCCVCEDHLSTIVADGITFHNRKSHEIRDSHGSSGTGLKAQLEFGPNFLHFLGGNTTGNCFLKESSSKILHILRDFLVRPRVSNSLWVVCSFTEMCWNLLVMQIFWLGFGQFFVLLAYNLCPMSHRQSNIGNANELQFFKCKSSRNCEVSIATFDVSFVVWGIGEWLADVVIKQVPCFLLTISTYFHHSLLHLGFWLPHLHDPEACRLK